MNIIQVAQSLSIYNSIFYQHAVFPIIDNVCIVFLLYFFIIDKNKTQYDNAGANPVNEAGVLRIEQDLADE